MNLFSRHVVCVYEQRGEEIAGVLSKGRLEDRAENIKKTEDGLEFCIIRHLNAWTKPWAMKLREQIWHFNIKEKKLELLSEND